MTQGMPRPVFDRVGLSVPDFATAERWYGDTFGLLRKLLEPDTEVDSTILADKSHALPASVEPDWVDSGVVADGGG